MCKAQLVVDGDSELVLGNEYKAYEYLQQAVHLADGGYPTGFLALRMGHLNEAAQYLDTAAENEEHLGHYFSKYGISAVMSLPITDEITVHVGPDLRGVLLGLVEVYQRLERWHEALRCLEKLREIEPYDIVVRLSIAEILLQLRPNDPKVCKRIIHLAGDVENDSPIHAALMLYKAQALHRLA